MAGQSMWQLAPLGAVANLAGHFNSLLIALAEAFEANAETLASIESLVSCTTALCASLAANHLPPLSLLQDNGKAYGFAKGFDVAEAAACLRYYGGWADKNHGKVSSLAVWG